MSFIFSHFYLLLIPLCFSCRKAVPSEQILGNYTNTAGTRKMTISAQDGLYDGVITWTSDPNDQVKPGDTLLSGLQHKGNKWKGQARFDGSVYSCTVTMPDATTLRLSVMGRSKDWKKD